MGFIYPALNQIISHAAECVIVLEAGYIALLSFEPHLAAGFMLLNIIQKVQKPYLHTFPGLQVVIPSSPKRAYGLLLAAIRNEDPVIFLEPKRIYRLVKQPVEDNGKALPLGKCFTLKKEKMSL